MTDRKTTFKVGFDADLSGLKRINEEVGRLRQLFERLTGSVGATSDKIGGMEKQAAGLSSAQRPPAPPSGVPPRRPGRSDPDRPRGHRGVMDSVGQRIPAPVRGATRAVGAGVRGVAGGMGLGAAAGMLGGAGLAVGGAMYLASGIIEAKDYRLALDGVYKQLHLSKDAQAQFSSRLEKTAHSLGMTRSELAPLERSYISLAGAIQGVTEIQGQVHVAGNLARGLGMDVSQALPQFGQLAQSGVFGRHAGEDGLNVRDFATILSDSISRGDMKGREGELIQSVQSLVGVQMQMLTRPQNVAGMLDTMTAMNQTGDPGLTGSRGAQLLAQVAAGIRNPGAGAFGEFTAYKAFGGGDYYEFQKRKEEGAFGESNNLGAILGYFQKSMPDANARHFGMSKLLGVSMHQAEALERGYSKMDMGGKERKAFIDTLRDVAGGGEEGTQKLERMDFAKLPVLAELYKTEDPDQLRNLLSEERIGFDKEKINTIMADADPRRKALEEVMSMDMKLTEGESLQKSVAELKDINAGISDTLLQTMVPLLQQAVSALGAIKKYVAGIGKFFGVTEKSIREKQQQQLHDPEGHDVITGLRTPRMIQTENGLVPDPVDVMINEHLSGKAADPVERPEEVEAPIERSRYLTDEVKPVGPKVPIERSRYLTDEVKPVGRPVKVEAPIERSRYLTDRPLQPEPKASMRCLTDGSEPAELPVEPKAPVKRSRYLTDEVKPVERPEEVRAPIKPEVVTPIKPEEVRAPIKPEVVTPIKPEEVAPVVKPEVVGAPIKQEEVGAPIKSEEVRAPIKPEVVTPVVKPEVVGAPIKPDAHRISLEPAKMSDSMRATDKSASSPTTEPQAHSESSTPVYNHTANIFLDGVKQTTMINRSVGNGSSSKTVVPVNR